MSPRSSGVLLHLTSLPGSQGCGDLGAEARAFADFLASAKQRWWQMLPVSPVGYGDSPYAALSAFAGNPLLIDVKTEPLPNEGTVDYDATWKAREAALRRVLSDLDQAQSKRLAEFEEREKAWLDDFALYDAIKRSHHGKPWTAWEPALRDREPKAIEKVWIELAQDIAFAKAAQWLFSEQWESFRAYCNERGVGLIGDVPIFVAHDSADVWQHRELFDLDDQGNPNHIAGVPPDYFSETGQRWGNPLYRWKEMERTGYAWWVRRFESALRKFDKVRLDHFIGFVRYWRIPSHEPTAMNGKWMKGPGRGLFDAVSKALSLPKLPLIAEDLGAVTPAVKRLRRDLGLPGIRLIQFAFGTDPQAPSFLPHNHDRNAVVYTGTHDNDTSVGWFSGPVEERHAALRYMGLDADVAVDPSLELMRLAMASVARTCIVPMQDVLGLGTAARMNTPGTAQGNWRWRMTERPGQREAERLRSLTLTYGRA